VGSRSKARARAQASQEAANRPSGPQSGAAGRSRGTVSGGPVAQENGSSQPGDSGSGPVPPPRTVQVLAAIQAIEAVGVLVAAILAGLDTGSGKSYQLSSGIAITVIGVCVAALLGLVARGLLAGRRWTRTPALLTQLFAGLIAIYLLQAPRYDWGIPALLLAVAGFALLFAPPSMRLLTPGRADKPEPR
jgi:hypothetical protein